MTVTKLTSTHTLMDGRSVSQYLTSPASRQIVKEAAAQTPGLTGADFHELDTAMDAVAGKFLDHANARAGDALDHVSAQVGAQYRNGVLKYMAVGGIGGSFAGGLFGAVLGSMMGGVAGWKLRKDPVAEKAVLAALQGVSASGFGGALEVPAAGQEASANDEIVARWIESSSGKTADAWIAEMKQLGLHKFEDRTAFLAKHGMGPQDGALWLASRFGTRFPDQEVASTSY